MPSLDRGAQPVTQRGVDGGLVLQVAHPEGDVTGLVLAGELGDLARHRVGGVLVEEGQQVEEGALTQYRQ